MGAPSWLTNLADWTSRAWIAGGGLILGGLVLAGWAIRGDRSKGRRRCPKCWYDLRGTPGLRCSECGHTAASEKRLFKSRRRWRWAAAAGALQLCGIALFVPKIQRDGWLSLVPTTLILVAAPSAGETWGLKTGIALDVVMELENRISAGTLAPWQWEYVVRHKINFRTREVWPETVPIAVCMELPGWLGRCGITFQPQLSDSRAAKAGQLFSWYSWSSDVESERRQVLGDVTVTSQGIWFDVTVEQEQPQWSNMAGNLKAWQGRFHLPVRIVDSVDHAIVPVASSDLTEAIRGALKLSARLPSGCSYPCHNTSLSALLDRSKDPRLTDLAFGLRIELRRDEQVIQTIRLSPKVELEPVPKAEAWLYFERAGELPEGEGFRKWTLRVCGDGEMALYDWDKPKYWAGEFTVPLSEVLSKD